MLSIGSLQIGLPAVAAALSGFSDRPMRMVARRYGAEFAMAEVVLDELVLLQGKLRERILKIADDDHPIDGDRLKGAQHRVGAGPVRGVDIAATHQACRCQRRRLRHTHRLESEIPIHRKLYHPAGARPALFAV